MATISYIKYLRPEQNGVGPLNMVILLESSLTDGTGVGDKMDSGLSAIVGDSAGFTGLFDAWNKFLMYHVIIRMS